MEKTSKHVCILISLTLLAEPAWAATEWQIGRGAATADATGLLTYDSNVEGNKDGEDDFSTSLTPTVRYRRIDSLVTSEASLSATAQRYFENSEFDNETYRANYSLQLPRNESLRTYGLGFLAGYNESVDIDPDISQRVGSQTFKASITGDVMLARSHLLNAEAGYTHTERDIGSTHKSYNLGGGYSYSLNDGTKLGASYRHRVSQTESDDPSRPSLDQTSDEVDFNASRPLYAEVEAFGSVGYRWLDRGDQENRKNLADDNNYTLRFGLQGQFLPKKYFPKTTGTFRIAYEDAVTPGLNDNASARLVGLVSVDWQARDATSVGFTVSRSQDLTVTDDTVVNNSISLRAVQRIGYFVSATAIVGYTQSSYSGFNTIGAGGADESDRTDKRYNASLLIGYQINSNWSAGLNYTYQISNSSRANSDFERHTVTLHATYAF